VAVFVSEQQDVSGFEAGFFAQLDAIERTHFWFAARNALIAWALNRYFPHAKTFLDVGAGTGQVVASLQRACPHLRFTVVEPFASGLAIAAERLRDVELVQADASKLPYDNEFDVAGAFDVIEHIDDDIAVLREIGRTLRPRGGLLITVPQHPFLWSPVDDYAHHRRRYTRTQLVTAVETAGFTVLRQTSFVTLLFPALLASRSTHGGKPVASWPEFHVSPAVNATGRLLMTVERQLIRAGVSLPFGGSLLLVARRA
jgi:ubiquinone/menaquinone biosynthesis C-methylase UbiE